MRLYLTMVVLAVGGFWLGDTATAGDAPSAADILEYRVPPPPSVGTRELDVGFEVGAPVSTGSVHKMADGRFMLIGGGAVRYSSDGGKTWTEPEKLSAGISFAIRLNDGKLGGPAGWVWHTSADEGKTWEKGGKMHTSNLPGGPYGTGAASIVTQTKSGRLVYVLRFTSGAGHNGLYERTMSWGTLNGQLTPVEGHAHWPEPDIGFAYYSDDQGTTWKKSEGAIMVWHQDGYGGMWPCDEPSIVTASNDDVIMFFRTTLGRVYTSRSREEDYFARNGKRVQRKPGERFDFPQPTPLAGSYSPCAIQKIEKTGDLLIVWNQISGDELRGSYRRGRLSSAISKDDGKTWEHFRCLDTVVLPPFARVAPDPEPQMGRGFDYVGVLPADYGGVSYPAVAVADDTVFLFWGRSVVKGRKGDVTGRRMRVLPLSWFYEEDKPLPPGPRLLLEVSANDSAGNWNSFEIPSDYYDGRFFVNLKDVAVYLKSPVGRLGYNMYAPLNQVITCLGWTAAYDRSKLEDADDPRLVVRCTHPHVTGAPSAVPPAIAAVAELKPIPGAIRISPVSGIPVNLFGVAVGTKKTVTFDSPIDPAAIAQAWLEMEGDDIDDTKEATILLNGKTPVAVTEDVLIPQGRVWGRLEVPASALVKGANTFEFTFADNLGGQTGGYEVHHALLVVKMK